MTTEAEATTTTQDTSRVEGVSSFSKSLFLGEIHQDVVFPFPRPREEEREKVRGLISSLRECADEHYDWRQAEEDRWVGDGFIRELGERGILGLYVPEKYGGQGLSQTGYCRVFETIAQIDPTLSVVLGVHQSIGLKGIALFGSDDQKERFLPDLASGRRLAGFALTEPNAGSDAYHLESRAVHQSDGSWLLNGEKRWIGNGDKGSVFVTFARAEVSGKDRHIALILEKGMKGFEVGHRYDTMGLRANDLRALHFNDVRVPPENVLGEPGDGFKIAMHILNNGRMSLATGSVGSAKWLLDGAIAHVTERRQFGRRLADFELVQDKIGWMVAQLFGLESMAYMTTGRRGGRELREILYWRWDPIGIAGAALPYNGDEYESYVGPIVNLLHTGADDREVARHLEDVEPGGLTVSSDHHRETADLITA